MRVSPWRWLILAMVVVLVAAGCADDGGDLLTLPSSETTTSAVAATTAAVDPPTSTTTQPVTTTQPPTVTSTTTQPPSTTSTTTQPPSTAPTTTSGAFSYTGRGTFPDVLGGPLDAHGSGCVPGPGALPDGIWFGFPEAWTTLSINFDLACFYTGDAATAQATARGEESPPSNDYIITNDNTTLRVVPVAVGAIGHRLSGSIETYPVPVGEFIADPGAFQDCPQFCLMWLVVNAGEVTEIVSQFVP